MALALKKKNNFRGLGAHFYGEERCVRNDTTGLLEAGAGVPCVKTHSYYQWVPYVLLLQVKGREIQDVPERKSWHIFAL